MYFGESAENYDIFSGLTRTCDLLIENLNNTSNAIYFLQEAGIILEDGEEKKEDEKKEDSNEKSSDNKQEEKDKKETSNKTSKTLWEKIKDFFKGIGEWFKGLWEKFKGLFDKKKKDEKKVKETEKKVKEADAKGETKDINNISKDLIYIYPPYKVIEYVNKYIESGGIVSFFHKEGKTIKQILSEKIQSNTSTINSNDQVQIDKYIDSLNNESESLKKHFEELNNNPEKLFGEKILISDKIKVNGDNATIAKEDVAAVAEKCSHLITTYQGIITKLANYEKEAEQIYEELNKIIQNEISTQTNPKIQQIFSKTASNIITSCKEVIKIMGTANKEYDIIVKLSDKIGSSQSSENNQNQQDQNNNQNNTEKKEENK